MPLPQPKIALNNACSVIFNNTLYTYSADAFQSLRLESGAKWEQLAQGEKVTGGVCVGSTTGTQETSAFFVVGGTGGSEGYHGLQKYTYSTGKWETIELQSKVTDQRLGHGAVYLNSTDSILVYGGAQDGSQGGSATTFTIGASAPHSIFSCDSIAPPARKPILLPWSAGEVVMVGGSTSNTQVMLFKAAEGRWVDSGATLAAPLPKDTSAIQAVLMTGDDGSKHLITFDMTVSPNTVQRTVLYNGPGVPVVNAAPVRRRASRRGTRGSADKQRRAEPMTINNWPAYNSTLAPKATRSNFALAQGADGTVVIAGGNDKDVLCMYDAKENSWEDAGSKLGQIRLQSTETESSSLSSATRTSTKSASSSSTLASSTTVSVSASTTAAVGTETPSGTAVPAVSGGSGVPLNTILASALGGAVGLIIILVLLYVCLKRRRERKAHAEAGQARGASAASSNEKDGIGFAKETLAFSPGPPGGFRGHQPHGSQSSFSSMAILMGRTGGQGKSSAPSGLGRQSSDASRRDSGDSTFRAFKSMISKPIPQETVTPGATRPAPPQPQRQPQPQRDEKGVAFAANANPGQPKARNLTTGPDNKEGTTRRSSGWNRYWSGGSALNLLGFGSGNGGGNNNGNGPNNGPSNAAAVQNYSQRTTVVSDRSSNYSNRHRMTQDSATVPPLFPGPAEPRMSFSRVTAHSPTIAVYNDKLKEGLSGRIEIQRPVSAVSDMSASAYSSGIPESVHEAWDPTSANKPWGADRSLNDSFTGIYSTPLAPASHGSKGTSAATAGSGQSTQTRQAPPRPAPPAQSQRPMRDDMSWLNLGDQKR